MIYDFEGHLPKIDPGSWAASNAVIIGRVELKKNSNVWFNTTLRGDLEPIIIGENSIFKMEALFILIQVAQQ